MTTCLWFDGNAEEDARFYASLFKKTKIGKIARYGEAGPGPKGKAMTVPFTLNGQAFLGLNGGPNFKFNESVSFIVNCKTQKEIDHYWAKLTRGGKEVQCGWLKDKFGLSWQVVPAQLGGMMQDKDAERSARVMKSLLQMV